jgi:hypothetical protein
MKEALRGILILLFSILLLGITWTETVSESPEQAFGAMKFLPRDDEIAGWKRSEKFLRASNEEELYRIINGGASLYIQHGFRSYLGQTYEGPKRTEIEVYIFDQGTPQNAGGLFENPYMKPGRIRDIANLGEKARIDMTPLFCYGVDFIQKGFYVRVIIQDRTEEGLSAAISFAQFIAKRIK